LAFDPTFAQAVPDLQLARTIQQQGMSAAPALPAQAVSRLAQALTGAFIEHQATSNLARATSGTAKDMAKTLEKVDPNNRRRGRRILGDWIKGRTGKSHP
jgi:hypothetical protein